MAIWRKTKKLMHPPNKSFHGTVASLSVMINPKTRTPQDARFQCLSICKNKRCINKITSSPSQADEVSSITELFQTERSGLQERCRFQNELKNEIISLLHSRQLSGEKTFFKTQSIKGGRWEQSNFSLKFDEVKTETQGAWDPRKCTSLVWLWTMRGECQQCWFYFRRSNGSLCWPIEFHLPLPFRLHPSQGPQHMTMFPWQVIPKRIRRE